VKLLKVPNIFKILLEAIRKIIAILVMPKISSFDTFTGSSTGPATTVTVTIGAPIYKYFAIKFLLVDCVMQRILLD
jgi:hypothetical protein